MTVSRSAHLVDWLRRLDSYTNAEFGLSRTLAVTRGACVACARDAQALNANGFCEPCAAKRQPDYTELQLFRPLRRFPRPVDELQQVQGSPRK